MKDDTISRQAAISTVERLYRACEGNPADYRDLVVAAFLDLPSAQQNCDGCKWSDAIGYGECHHCKRAFEDMYEKGEQP